MSKEDSAILKAYFKVLDFGRVLLHNIGLFIKYLFNILLLSVFIFALVIGLIFYKETIITSGCNTSDNGTIVCAQMFQSKSSIR